MSNYRVFSFFNFWVRYWEKIYYRYSENEKIVKQYVEEIKRLNIKGDETQEKLKLG